jgi:hypothetical protein
MGDIENNVSKLSELSDHKSEGDAQPQPDKLGAELKHSRPINYLLWSDSDEMNGCVERLYKEDLAPYLVGQRERGTTQKKAILNTLLCNLFALNQADPRVWLAVNLRKDFFWRIPMRYKNEHITDWTFPKIVHALEKAKLVEGYIGFLDRTTGVGRLTRIRATDKLLHELVGVSGMRSYMLDEIADSETIILKNLDKKLIGYEDYEFTLRAREKLNVIREAISTANFNLKITNQQEMELKQEIELKLKKHKKKYKWLIDFSRTDLVRIFNNERFDHGGRFYRHWIQSIPKDYRKYIVLNGKPTVEIDYSTLHPMMLYAKAGQPLPAAPYALKGFDIPEARDICKMIFNTMVNAESTEIALYSIAEHPLMNIQLTEKYPTPASVMNAMLEKHKPVARYLNSKVGLELQYLDSEIAQQVMLKLLEYNIVAVPIHDSFIVQYIYEDVLKDTMKQVFEEYVGVPTDPKVKETLFPEITRSSSSIGNELNPENQIRRALAIKEEQEQGLSPFLNYESRNTEFFERMKYKSYIPM